MNTEHQYRKKPVVIDAFQLPAAGEDVPDAFRDWCERVGFTEFESDRDEGIVIQTLEGAMRADPGDWIIKGLKGEFYPCKPDIFAATYEAAAAPVAPPELPAVIEQIAQQWDGCEYDGMQEEPDIGKCIRAAGRRLLKDAAAPAAPQPIGYIPRFVADALLRDEAGYSLINREPVQDSDVPIYVLDGAQATGGAAPYPAGHVVKTVYDQATGGAA